MSRQMRTAGRIFLADTRSAIAEQVSAWGAAAGDYSVEVFGSNHQLVRRLDVERPDLVLSKLGPAPLDGVTLVRRLQATGIPVALLSRQTRAGAHGSMEGLLAGAADCFLTRRRQGRERLALPRAHFLRRVRELIDRGDRPADVEDATTWYRLAIDRRGRWVAGTPTMRPFPEDRDWIGVMLARTCSLGRLLRACGAAPARPRGGILIGTSLPLRFTRALAEVATRLWNRPVLELGAGERLRGGQWRVIPGRRLLLPVPGTGGAAFRWEPSRAVSETALLRQRIERLAIEVDRPVRLYLFDPPDARLARALQAFAGGSGAVYLQSAGMPIPNLAVPAGPRAAARWREEESDVERFAA